MNVLINETKEIKKLPQVITQFEELRDSITQTEEWIPEYEATMDLDDYNWWLDVEKGIEIAEEQGLDTIEFDFDNFIALANQYE